MENIERKLAAMNDVAYEKPKLDFLYRFAEKSLETTPHLELVIERLQILEQIRKEAPNLEAQFG